MTQHQPSGRKRTWLRWGGALLILVGLTGCSTPASRIKKNPDLFASFPPEAQALIQQGRIDLGFESGMVAMALGAPTDVYETRNEQGDLLVWAYRDLTTDHHPYPYAWGYGGCVHGPTCRRCYRVPTPYYGPVVRHQAAERLRVTFRDGVVVEIQRLDRSKEF